MTNFRLNKSRVYYSRTWVWDTKMLQLCKNMQKRYMDCSSSVLKDSTWHCQGEEVASEGSNPKQTAQRLRHPPFPQWTASKLSWEGLEVWQLIQPELGDIVIFVCLGMICSTCCCFHIKQSFEYVFDFCYVLLWFTSFFSCSRDCSRVLVSCWSPFSHTFFFWVVSVVWLRSASFHESSAVLEPSLLSNKTIKAFEDMQAKPWGWVQWNQKCGFQQQTAGSQTLGVSKKKLQVEVIIRSHSEPLTVISQENCTTEPSGFVCAREVPQVICLTTQWCTGLTPRDRGPFWTNEMSYEICWMIQFSRVSEFFQSQKFSAIIQFPSSSNFALRTLLVRGISSGTFSRAWRTFLSTRHRCKCFFNV